MGKTKHKSGRRRRMTARKRQRIFRRCLFAVVVLAGILLILKLAGRTEEGDRKAAPAPALEDRPYENLRPELTVDLLDINSYSRPGIALDEVNGIVIHYTANPGTSAKANRDYFNNLQSTHTTKASSHFVIGLEGEILQCIPCNEIAYASNNRNKDTIAIECCIEDGTGRFNQATYDAVIALTGWLALRYDLTTDDVIRHYDVTGKSCPKYFVDHPDEWEVFKADVAEWMEENK